MISYHESRPLIVCLHGIGPNADEYAGNITPLDNWAGFNADVYSVGWYKGEIGHKSWGGCVNDLGVQVKGLQDKHNPSVTVYIGFSTGFLVGCKETQHYTKSPWAGAGVADAMIGFYPVSDLTKDDFMTDPVNVRELFSIFLTGTVDRDAGKEATASPVAHSLDFPVLCIHGDSDTVAHYRQSEYLRDMGAELMMVPGENHGFSIFKYPDVFSRVKGFIQEVQNGQR